jgi:hypothetical protein
MPDSLVAKSAEAYLTPLAVVHRLKAEFSYVEADGEEGRRHVLETIERLRAEWSRRQVDHQVVERLASVKNRALFVCFGDDAGSDLATLGTYVVPGMPLAFEYASAKHENAVQHLLTRCATALGYEILKDRRITDASDYRGPERRLFRRERRRFIERRAQKERRKSVPSSDPGVDP